MVTFIIYCFLLIITFIFNREINFVYRILWSIIFPIFLIGLYKGIVWLWNITNFQIVLPICFCIYFWGSARLEWIDYINIIDKNQYQDDYDVEEDDEKLFDSPSLKSIYIKTIIGFLVFGYFLFLIL